MSCYDLCSTSGSGLVRPQPIADSGNEPCVRQCPDSTTTIQPPAVVVTFPGPILSSFPQDSVVGSAGAPVLGASGGYGGYGSLGYGGYGSLGYGGYGSFGSFGSCSPWSSRYGRYGRGSCGSC
ncbi:KRSC protein, partial [Eulacestoma nigropectus]|nr:KRSC protein [Eulacestoma nigropectus]